MCLAIPMRVVAVNGLTAICEAKGIERDVNLMMMQHEPVSPGDMLMIHVGYALQKIAEEEARAAWDLYDEILAAQDTLAGQDVLAGQDDLAGQDAPPRSAGGGHG